MTYVHTREYTGMWLCSLTAEQRELTCNYWYTVTTFGATPHTAFRTKAALLEWLHDRGLTVDGTIPDHGNWGCWRIVGTYRQAMHVDRSTFEPLKGERTRDMSNADYTLAIIARDADGLRTVHTLNPNVRDRPTFDHALSRKFEDEGRSSAPLPHLTREQ